MGLVLKDTIYYTTNMTSSGACKGNWEHKLGLQENPWFIITVVQNIVAYLQENP